MGDEICSSVFSEEDFERFQKALREETDILESWFKQKKFVFYGKKFKLSISTLTRIL